MPPAVIRQGHAELPQVVLAGEQPGLEAAALHGRQDDQHGHYHDGGRHARVQPAEVAGPGGGGRVRRHPPPPRSRRPDPPRLREHVPAGPPGQARRRRLRLPRLLQPPQLPPGADKLPPVCRIALQAGLDRLALRVVQGLQQVAKHLLSNPIGHRGRWVGVKVSTQFLDGGVQTALDRAHGNAQDVGRLTVLQTLKVHQQHHLSGLLRKLVYGTANRLALFGKLALLDRSRLGAAEHLYQRPGGLVAQLSAHPPVQAGHAVPHLPPLVIDGLVGRHRI